MISPYLPPVRCTVYPGPLLAALRGIGSKPPVTQGIWLNSGETALAVSLQLIGRSRPSCRQVIAPDFVCPAVPKAIIAAGFEPVLVPIDPLTWFYRPSELDTAVSPRTAAVVLVGYHGMIPPLPDWIDPILDRHNVPTLADWAPCYGVGIRSYGRAALAIYSFGPGKSLPAGGGGLIVPLTDAGQELLATAPFPLLAGAAGAAIHLLRMLSQAAITSRAIWPFLPDALVRSSGANTEANDAVFGAVPGWIGRYIANAAASLSHDLVERRAVCRKLHSRLHDVPAMTLPAEGLLENGTCIRYPVILDTPDSLERVRDALVRNRLIKGGYRWDVHAAGPGGQDIARRLLTLPTYCRNPSVLDGIAHSIRTAIRP